MNYIGVSGFGWSGSGAVVDFLKEFDSVGELNFEFSLIWEPNGIMDLESSLIDSWDFLRHDASMRNFIKYCEKLDKKANKFNPVALDMSNRLKVDFITESIKYIESLTDFKYKGYTRLFDYHESAFGLLYHKFLRKMFKQTFSSKEMYMARPSEDVFLSETRKYFDKLFLNYRHLNNVSTILLDQALPVAGITRSMRYFNGIKSIIVDRDPRDIYVDLINHDALIGIECKRSTRESTQKYIKWYSLLRQNRDELLMLEEKNKVLCLKFEDMVLDYEKSINKIGIFLELDFNEHTLKNKYFDPSVSSKNIGLWKTYPNQNEINYIYNNLRDYCYD